MTKGEQTRRDIVEKAAPLFNQKGFEGTSLADLMQATGLQKGGIYRHFSGKKELAAEAFDYAWEKAVRGRLDGVADVPDCVDRLKKTIDNFVERRAGLVPGGCPLMNTAVEADDGNPVLREKARAALNEWRSVIAEIVRDGQRGRELHKDVDPVAVATIVISSLEGAIMFSRLEKTREALFTVGKHLDGYLRSLSRL